MNKSICVVLLVLGLCFGGGLSCKKKRDEEGEGAIPKHSEGSAPKNAKNTGKADYKSIPKLDFESYQLANGLKVILHVDRKIPVVNVNLWYHVGSKNEEPGRTGFAHLFEHLMFQESKHVKGEYLVAVEKAGANFGTGGINGTTSSDRTNYFETVPSSALEYVLWLESDRMGFLLEAMSKKNLDNQRAVVQNEKRTGDNRPYAVERYLIADHMYPKGHPYSWTVIGSLEDLDRATLDDVKNFFMKYYAPNNASLTLSGDIDVARAKELIQKYFGSIPSGPTLSRVKVDIPTLSQNKYVVANDRVSQPKLILNWHTPAWFDDAEAPLDYAAQVLGSGKNSRLYKRLVRKLQWATSVSAVNSARESAGMFQIEVMVRPGNSLEEVKRVVLDEVSKLAKKGPTNEELERQKALMEFSFVSSLERIGGFGGKADQLNRYNTFLGSPDFFQKDYERYQNVVGSQVRTLFNDWVAKQNYLDIRILPETAGRPDAKEFDRSKIPSLEGSEIFKAPEVKSKKLENGLEIFVSTRSQIPKVAISVLIKVGDLKERTENAGVSFLTASSVDEGTKNRSSLEISAEMEKLGTGLSAGGSKYGSSVSTSVLKKNVSEAMDILSDVVLNPTFPDSEIEIVKKRRLDEIALEDQDPSVVSRKVFPKLLFAKGHPAHTPSQGSKKSISSISAADLRENHKKFWRPNNAAVIFTGDIDLEDAVVLTKKYLGGWSGKAEVNAKAVEAEAPKKLKIYLIDKQGAPQSRIRIGSVAPNRYSEDRVPIQIMNELLGGAFSSRLNLNLREDKGWAYGAGSAFYMERIFGMWFAAAGVQTKYTAQSLVEFRREIEGMTGKRPIGVTELRGIKANMMRGYIQEFESIGQVMDKLSPLVSYGLSLDQLEKFIPQVSVSTLSSVTKTAKKYLNFNRTVVLVVGDLKEIEKPIRALGWGEVEVLGPATIDVTAR